MLLLGPFQRPLEFGETGEGGAVLRIATCSCYTASFHMTRNLTEGSEVKALTREGMGTLLLPGKTVFTCAYPDEVCQTH
jgi:hypothetical protein